MEAQGGAGSPADPNIDVQKLLKPSSSGELSKEPSHHPTGEEDGFTPGHISGLLHVAEKRQPLSSVSSLEVHFDLLDLTELTDMSDQELAEVFVDSDEENHNESFAGAPAELWEKELEVEAGCESQSHLLTGSLALHMMFQNSDSLAGHRSHHPPLQRGGYMRSPSWTRCGKAEQQRDRKHHSDSESTQSYRTPKQP